MQARVGIGGFKQDLVFLDHVELVTLEQRLEELRKLALALWGGAVPVQGTEVQTWEVSGLSTRT